MRVGVASVKLVHTQAEIVRAVRKRLDDIEQVLSELSEHELARRGSRTVKFFLRPEQLCQHRSATIAPQQLALERASPMPWREGK